MEQDKEHTKKSKFRKRGTTNVFVNICSLFNYFIIYRELYNIEFLYVSYFRN